MAVAPLRTLPFLMEVNRRADRLAMIVVELVECGWKGRQMRPSLQLFALLAAIGLAACTEAETYPLSGEECAPDDPVHQISAADCVSPTGTGI